MRLRAVVRFIDGLFGWADEVVVLMDPVLPRGTPIRLFGWIADGYRAWYRASGRGAL